ncbi:MAG: ROK family transcriptional regulator [Pseudomonadota bacterium]
MLHAGQTGTPRGSQTGTNATLVRDHNERSVLTLLRTQGPMAGASVAKATGVSAQTASVILRSLEDRGLVEKHAPVKGKVGKPKVPYGLRAEGAYSVGFRLGRRSADLTLLNFHGETIWETSLQYPFPMPEVIDQFVSGALTEIVSNGYCPEPDRIVGIGVAAPFELWNWLEGLGAPKEKADLWRDQNFVDAFSAFTDLPVFVENDVNLSAGGELAFGIGQSLQSFGYFYIGAFIGGAVVIDRQVYHGLRGNAGAFGSMPTGDTRKTNHQLIAEASIYRLEKHLSAQRGSLVNLRRTPGLWGKHADDVTVWLEEAAPGLAKAIVNVAAVLDFSDFVVDGVFPGPVRTQSIALINRALQQIDQQGLFEIRVHEGTLGPASGVRGAGYQPILKTLFN